jgi:hypothetical protein
LEPNQFYWFVQKRSPRQRASGYLPVLRDTRILCKKRKQVFLLAFWGALKYYLDTYFSFSTVILSKKGVINRSILLTGLIYCLETTWHTNLVLIFLARKIQVYLRFQLMFLGNGTVNRGKSKEMGRFCCTYNFFTPYCGFKRR